MRGTEALAYQIKAAQEAGTLSPERPLVISVLDAKVKDESWGGVLEAVYSLDLSLRHVGARDCVRVLVTSDHQPSEREGRFVRGTGLDWHPSR